MIGKRWLRKDVIIPIFYLLAFGVGLGWLFSLFSRAPEAAQSEFFRFCIIAVIVFYLLLVYITVRHVMTTYDLERYEPGNPDSLKRLISRRRYQLPHHQLSEEALLVALDKDLRDQKYQLETESHQIGRIYLRRCKIKLLGSRLNDRVIILQHEPLNVFMVDQLLKDCIRHINAQTTSPSRRNLLILVTRMAETQDAISAAAGVVNFLGKIKSGSLCPLLLATRQHRLFYPADRTLMPRSHQLFQDMQMKRIKKLIRDIPVASAETESDSKLSETPQQPEPIIMTES